MIIPGGLLRTASVYRTWGDPPRRFGVGFWLGSPGYVEHDVHADYWALGLVLRGGGVFAGRTLTPGTAFVRHPGVVNDFRIEPGYAECWLDLGGALAGLPQRLGLTAPEQAVFAPGLDLVLVRRWDRLLQRSAEAPPGLLPVLAAEVIALAAELIEAAGAVGASEPHAALIADAARLLDGGATRTALERLARQHGLSFERLRAVFRGRTGASLGAYRLARRMDRARALLRDGDLTVAEVAAAVGCASTATFSAQFKVHAGVPPDAWRRAQK